jgi:hypothetical protein
VAEGSYTREHLLSAWLDAERYRRAHPDVADYHNRRAWAMCGAFGVWFDVYAEEHFQLHALFRSAVRQFNRVHAPWVLSVAGRPAPEYEAIKRHHAPSLEAAVERLRDTYRALLLELMERIWGLGHERTVPRDALREHGFDPDTPEPDWDAYW